MLLASLPLIVGLSVPSPLDLDEAAPEPEVTRPRTRAVTHLALGPWVAAPAIHEWRTEAMSPVPAGTISGR